MTDGNLPKGAARQKCRGCNGAGEISLSPLARQTGHAVMPMVTCPKCDGLGREGISLKPYVSPTRMADGSETA